MKTTNFKISKKISAPINGTDCVMLKYLSMRVYLVVVSLTIVATPCVSRQRHGASKSGADNFGHQYRTCDQVPPMWTDFVVPYQERFENYVQLGTSACSFWLKAPFSNKSCRQDDHGSSSVTSSLASMAISYHCFVSK